MSVVPVRDQVFVSYSHKDREWLTTLVDLLKPMVRNGSIKLWSDLDIKPGQRWLQEIDRALSSAKVAVLLVSANFLASEFIVNHEIPRLLNDEQLGLLKVVWMAVGSSLYEETDLAQMQAATDPAHPLNTLPHSSAEQELVRVAKLIKQLMK